MKIEGFLVARFYETSSSSHLHTFTRNKLKKFNDLLSFTNVYENYDPTNPRLMANETTEVDRKGKWRADHFKNDNPLVLELACGRGEYTLALGADNPDINYIGLDVKGARIWQGATKAIEREMTDDPTLYEFTQETFEECEFLEVIYDKDDIYSAALDFPELEHKTYYERKHLEIGRKIKFIKARLNK